MRIAKNAKLKNIDGGDGCFVSDWWYFLEEQRSHAAHFALLLHKDFKVLVDDGHSQEDSRTRTNGAQEVSHDRQPAYTEATKGSSCGDVPADSKAIINTLIFKKTTFHMLQVTNMKPETLFALYLLSSCTIEVSLCPLITICCSFSCFAT